MEEIVNNTPNDKLRSPISKRLVAFCVVLSVCFVPTLLNWLGFEFASVTPTSLTSELALQDNPDQLFYALAGALHHALLEWSAVVIAILTMVLSLVHYRIKKDLTVPTIGIALLCAGFMDAFHTLAATRIIEANTPNTDFIPFTWAISRIFNSTILIVAAVISLWLLGAKSGSQHAQKYPIRYFVVIALVFFAVSYWVVNWAASTDSLPQTMFSDAVITRPYDILPLAIFVLAASLFSSWYRRSHSRLQFSLLLSMLPAITTQLHMAFGSTALFDNHFNIAHALKVVAYGVIFIGLLLDFISDIGMEEDDSPETKTSFLTTLNCWRLEAQNDHSVFCCQRRHLF